MKNEIRVLGFDDAPFNKFKDKETIVFGTLFRGGTAIDGVLSFKVKIDGSDSTNKLIQTVMKSKFKPQIQAIFLDGIAFGGFNIIDIKRVHEKTKIPVVVIVRNYPDFKKIEDTLTMLGMEKKIKLIKKAGKPIKINNIYSQFVGIEKEELKKMMNVVCSRSHIPECIRVSHLIGAGLYFGESKGKA